MTEHDINTDVLIVGTGPMGVATALALATYGIDCLAITKYNALSTTPRAHITNQRTMEVLRDLDVADEVSLYASDWDTMGDSLITTSLAGPEIARIRAWGTGDDRRTEYLSASPTPMADIPQPYLENVLIRNAAARGARIRYGTEYLSHTQDADGVTVLVRDRASQSEITVRAKFLVGADGAQSQVARDAGLPVVGDMGRASTAYVSFAADLTRYVEHRPSILYWIASPAAQYGEIGLGLLRAVRPWTEWIAGWGFDPTAGEPDFSSAALTTRITALIGADDVDIQIKGVSTWKVNQAYATAYSAGRVFCGGDAVHRHPPSNGLGSNTSIQDGYNLAWKLAFVIRGHAGLGLLESYSEERSPIGKQIVERANRSRLDFAALTNVIGGAKKPYSASTVVDIINDPGPEGADIRARLTAALDLKNYEFNAHGVEMNQRYRSPAIVAGAPAASANPTTDPELYYVPSVEPGAKIPHAWLVNARGRRISTLDIVGQGRFTLVTGLSGGVWREAVEALRLPYLSLAVIGKLDAADLYRDWDRAAKLADDAALLVRPDGYIAWSSMTAPKTAEAATALLRDTIRSVLSVEESA